MELDLWNEAVGMIKDIREENGAIVVVMEKTGDIILYPDNKLFIQKIKEMKGKKISIIHTDIPDKKYLLMEMKI